MEKENNTTYRTHRVGSVTAGLCMIVFGILLLSCSLFKKISYDFIFALWPIILIGLGMELLLSNFSTKKIVYDKAAVFILIVMTLFAMAMAVTDVWLQASVPYLYN